MESYTTRLEKSGRILIPSAIRRQLGLSEGSQVIVKVEKSGAIYLKAGWHPISVDWFNGVEKYGLEVEYDGVGGILGKILYEHGAVVKKELFDAESVIPK